MPHFHPTLATFLNWIFPASCLGCDCCNAWLCQACLAKLTSEEPAPCLRCQRPLETGSVCSECLAAYTPLQTITCVGAYRTPLLRRAIAQLKYQGVVGLAPPLGLLLAEHIEPADPTMTVLVPAPMDRWRQRTRGLHHSFLLAQAAGRQVGLPVVTGLNKKRRPTQVSRTEAERLHNLAGAITTANAAAVRGKHVIVIDDVFTTGATAVACAGVLKQAGATSVELVTLAHG